jgi:hypothetical protein
MKLWIARDENNSLWCYSNKPQYCHGTKEWFNWYDKHFEIDCELFPEVTFENSPQEIELNLVSN